VTIEQAIVAIQFLLFLIVAGLGWWFSRLSARQDAHAEQLAAIEKGAAVREQRLDTLEERFNDWHDWKNSRLLDQLDNLRAQITVPLESRIDRLERKQNGVATK